MSVFAFLIFIEAHCIISLVAKGSDAFQSTNILKGEVTYLRKSVLLRVLDTCVLAKLFWLVTAEELAN